MQAIDNINLASLLDTFVSLSAAFILGGLIGFERQYRQRTAGLRTHVLVAVGAAVDLEHGAAGVLEPEYHRLRISSRAAPSRCLTPGDRCKLPGSDGYLGIFPT